MKPKFFHGGISSDHRGSVSFNNNLVLNKIKRFYLVENKLKKILLELGMVIKLKLNIFFASEGKQKYRQLKLIILKSLQKKQSLFMDFRFKNSRCSICSSRLCKWF